MQIITPNRGFQAKDTNLQNYIFEKIQLKFLPLFLTHWIVFTQTQMMPTDSTASLSSGPRAGF